MSKFLDYTGLNKLVEIIKNKFQKKPYQVLISISGNNVDGYTIEILNDISFYNELKANHNGDALFTNIDYSIQFPQSEGVVNAKASSVVCESDYFIVCIDCNTYSADNGIQCIGHLSFYVFNDGSYDAYYTEQEHVYSEDVLLTGTTSINKDNVGFSKIYNKYPDNFTQEEIEDAFYYKDHNNKVACWVNGIFYVAHYVDDDTISFKALISDHQIDEYSITRNGQYGNSTTNLAKINSSIALTLRNTGNGSFYLADDGLYKALPVASSDNNGVITPTMFDNLSAMYDKLEGIEDNANNYSHPSYTSYTGNPNGNATPAFGETVTVSQISTDNLGHVAALYDRTITIPNTVATTTYNGLMSATDKIKLGTIDDKADKTEVVVVGSTMDSSGVITCNLDYVAFDRVIKVEQNIYSGVYYGIDSLIIRGFTGHGYYDNTTHHEVLIEWDCGSNDMTLTLPDTSVFHWANDETPTFKEGWHYQLRVTYWGGNQSARDHYLGVCVGFPCEVV